MKLKPLLLVAFISLLTLGCNEKDSADVEPSANKLETDTAKISYIFGSNVGNQFKTENIDIDPQAFLLGLQDMLEGNEMQVSEEQSVAALQAFQEQQMAKQQEMLQVVGDANGQEGEAYMAENGAKEGVVTLESGLQYKEVEAGAGQTPSAEDVVEVHYRGTLLDGTEFDSSHKRGQPAQFGVNEVIPGWTEALQLMSEGAKWELVIPPQLAYGPGGTGGTIGPNQTLFFEVELLKVLPKEK